MKDLIKFEVGKIYQAVTQQTPDECPTIYIHKIISRTAKTAKVADGTLKGNDFNWFNEVAKNKKITVIDGVETLANYYTPVLASAEYIPAPVIAPVVEAAEKTATAENVIEKITAKIRLNEKGKAKICYNGKFSTRQMFENLQAQGLNFETSYGLLLKAVLFGAAKVTDAKIVDNSPNWSEVPDEGGWSSKYWAKRNLQSVALAILDKSFKIRNNHYLKTAVTSAEMINKILADIATKRGFNIQKHNDNSAPATNNPAPKAKAAKVTTPAESIEVTIKARNYADAMAQKAQILASGDNVKINIVIDCL